VTGSTPAPPWPGKDLARERHWPGKGTGLGKVLAWERYWPGKGTGLGKVLAWERYWPGKDTGLGKTGERAGPPAKVEVLAAGGGGVILKSSGRPDRLGDSPGAPVASEVSEGFTRGPAPPPRAIPQGACRWAVRAPGPNGPVDAGGRLEPVTALTCEALA